MPDPSRGDQRGDSPRRLLPRRTARLRLTVLYGAAFVACGACGAVLISVTFVLYGQLTPQAHPVQVTREAVRPGTSSTPAPSQGAPGVHVTMAGLGQVNLDRQQLLVISVVVIPAAEVDRLFQPFQRLGPRRARRDGGHGLGLSIARAIATAHAATITARPRPGGGLAVDVTFPPPAPYRG